MLWIFISILWLQISWDTYERGSIFTSKYNRRIYRIGFLHINHLIHINFEFVRNYSKHILFRISRSHRIRFINDNNIMIFLRSQLYRTTNHRTLFNFNFLIIIFVKLISCFILLDILLYFIRIILEINWFSQFLVLRDLQIFFYGLTIYVIWIQLFFLLILIIFLLLLLLRIFTLLLMILVVLFLFFLIGWGVDGLLICSSLMIDDSLLLKIFFIIIFFFSHL